jgi:hypothetical protein
VHIALVFGDDSLALPDEVAAQDPASVVGEDVSVQARLGEAGPEEDQSGAGLHRRAASGAHELQGQAQSSVPAVVRAGLHAGGKLVECDCAGQHRVTHDDQGIHAEHRPQVRPGVCRGGHGQSCDVEYPPRLQPAMSSHSFDSGNRTCARSQDVDRLCRLPPIRERQLKDPGSGEVREGER